MGSTTDFGRVSGFYSRIRLTTDRTPFASKVDQFFMYYQNPLESRSQPAPPSRYLTASDQAAHLGLVKRRGWVVGCRLTARWIKHATPSAWTSSMLMLRPRTTSFCRIMCVVWHTIFPFFLNNFQTNPSCTPRSSTTYNDLQIVFTWWS